MRLGLYRRVARCRGCTRRWPWLGVLLLLAVALEAAAIDQTIPMRKVNGVPLLRVHINGEGPYWFLLDTGFGSTFVVSERVAAELNLPIEEVEFTVEAAGGDAVTPAGGVRVERFKIDWLVELGGEIEGLVMDLAGLERCRAGGAPFDGIIGAAVFHQAGLRLILDYPSGRIRLQGGDSDAAIDGHVIP